MMGDIMKRAWKATLCVAGVLCMAMPAIAGEGGPVMKTVSVRDGGSGPSSERVTLGLNKAAIVELPADAADVLVSNPAIVDAIVRTPRRIYILGLSVGQTNAFFFSDSGKQLLNLEIRVERDIVALQDLLAHHFPKTNIRAESVNDNIVLTGVVPSASIAEQAREIAARYIGKPEQVFNMLTVAGREQVMIRVRVAEMQRVVAKQLGIDLKAMAMSGGVPITFNSFSTFPLNSQLGPGSVAGGLPARPEDLVNGGTNNVQGQLKAMERAGVLRLLSEPNLTAISGEEAKFLAGGEFPVPVGRDKDGRISIEFKPFGVGLAFTPVVLSEGRISLRVSSEVSELTNEGAIVLDDMSIPGLRVRRASSVVEMPSGASMMIAGLLRDDVKQNIEGYPGLKELPVLGALFRSRDFQTNQTELVIIVSAVLVDPVSGREISSPTDGFVPPTDAQGLLNGQTNATYTTRTVEAPAAPQPAAQPAGGYIIE